MTTKTIRIAEIHTGELTAECLRYIEHKHKGEVYAEGTTALFRGQVADAALCELHKQNFDVDWVSLLPHVSKQTQDMLESEGRPITESVKKNHDFILSDVACNLEHYRVRLIDYFDKCELIGVQVPVRLELEGEQFASHMDMLFRDEHGQIHVWDWKWQEEAPVFDYLSRNLQMGLYHLCVAYGQVCIDESLGLWETIGELPRLGWVDLARFKPYARATKTTLPGDEEPTEFEKGDDRPLTTLIKRWSIHPDREDELVRDIMLRVNMMKQGIFPKTPGKLRCKFCEARAFCGSYHK